MDAGVIGALLQLVPSTPHPAALTVALPCTRLVRRQAGRSATASTALLSASGFAFSLSSFRFFVFVLVSL